MATIDVGIQNIKGVVSVDLQLPLENGVYALVGGNGTGKSTVLQAIAQLIRPQNALFALKPNDYGCDSEVNFSYGNAFDKWCFDGNRWRNQLQSASRRPGLFNNIHINGMYEGSLFVGTRFQDSKQVDDLLFANKIGLADLVPADDYVIRHLSYILHGDYLHYASLKRLKNKALRERHRLRNLPYFVDSTHGGLISQYRMSSGECLLVSLLHFVYNAIIRSSLPVSLPVLMLLDEIELALHPVAVSRFLDLINEITRDYGNVTAILTTHAPEVIRRINPNNIYKLENENGTVTTINPCYPSYAIRELYTHDRYDYLVLCEDVLARYIIESMIREKGLMSSKLICVLPVGGWKNVLKLHYEIASNNVIGFGTKIISVLDGDVEPDCSKKEQYKDLPKLFLPIPSVEKFLYGVVYLSTDKALRKTIGDKYFMLKSIDTLVAEYNSENPTPPKHPEKSFYRMLIKDLNTRGVNENLFIEKLGDEIKKSKKFETFEQHLVKQLT